jgi:predicted kinase
MQPSLLLLQMAGTSGTGKTTLAHLIASHLDAIVIDYDVVKSAALDAGAAWELAGGVGYLGSQALARSLLQQGRSVILDSPCRFQQIVATGTAIAAHYHAAYAFIECVLSDESELRRRMQERPRQRSQRRAFDIPPPDAPNDFMRDSSGRIQIPQTIYPSSYWLQIDMHQSVARCLADALRYLEEIRAAKATNGAESKP